MNLSWLQRVQLADDWERLVRFYRFPREHWPHLRTANVVASHFATVRLRTPTSRRFKKVEKATELIWKLLQVAESTFRRLKDAELLSADHGGTTTEGDMTPTTKVS